MRLSTKYGVAVGLAAAVVASILAGLLYQAVGKVFRERAVEAQLVFAHSILDKIEDAQRHARRDIRILAQDEFLSVYVASKAFRTAQNNRLLVNELSERGGITGPWDDLLVVDRRGHYLLTTLSHQHHTNLSQNPASQAAFKAAMRGKIYQSDVDYSVHGGKPTLLFAAPIFSGGDEGDAVHAGEGESAEGEVVGMLVAHYHWPAIDAILSKAFKRGSLFLFNRNGDVIAAHPSPEEQTLPQQFMAHHAKVHLSLVAAGKSEAVHPMSYGGEEMVSAHVVQEGSAGLPSLGWGLLVEEPAEEVFAPARALAWQAALIVGGMLALLAISLTLLGHRLMRPLARLTRITQRIGEGDFQQHIDYQGNDEIGSLASSVNTMSAQLVRHEAALLKAKKRIESIIDTVPGIFYSATPDDLRTTFISPAVSTLLGYSVEAFSQDPELRLALLLEEDREKALAEIRLAMQQNNDFIVTYRVQHKDGKNVFWLEDRGSWEREASGQIVALHGVMTDITERKHWEEQLARTTRALDILHAQDTMLTRATSEAELIQGVCRIIVDKQVYPFAWVGLIEEVHPYHLQVAAYAGSDKVLCDKLLQNGLYIDKCDYLACRAIREKHSYLIKNRNEVHDGDNEPWPNLARQDASLISLPLCSDNNVLGALNIYSRESGVFDAAELHLLKELANNLAYGITALRTQALHNQAREQLMHQAFHDALTGLPNREMFMEALQMALAHADRSGEYLAVLFIDLDDFKLVNDTLGHPAGDELLRQVGERINDTIRGSDMVARQGGDEFIILMNGINSRQCNTVDPEQANFLLNPARQAQRLVERLQQPFTIDGQNTYIGASIGIAVYPHDARDAEVLLRYADTAMYRAKDVGRGTYAFYSSDLTEQQQKRISLANRLHNALEQEQFMLYYQPVVELASGALSGVEALIRWQSPEGEIIPPGDFLPVAEDTGLIIPIGDWVMAEACRQISEWQQGGFAPTVAVNLSVRQLWQGDVANTILAMIGKFCVASDALELEITESAMGHDMKHMEAVILSFHQGGLKIALDDFGTGYSSLSRLKQLPIHTLKIDKSFVDGIPEDEDDMSIVTATMQMAHSLGLRTLAEGIETAAQWAWLLERGCQYGQGYYFSQPVPASEITHMLQQGQGWQLPGKE